MQGSSVKGAILRSGLESSRAQALTLSTLARLVKTGLPFFSRVIRKPVKSSTADSTTAEFACCSRGVTRSMIDSASRPSEGQ